MLKRFKLFRKFMGGIWVLVSVRGCKTEWRRAYYVGPNGIDGQSMWLYDDAGKFYPSVCKSILKLEDHRGIRDNSVVIQ